MPFFPEPSNFRIYPTAKGELYFRLTVPGKSTHICNRNLVAQALPHGVERPGVSAIDNMLKYQLALLELERQWLLWRTNPNVEPGGMFININTLQAGTSITSIPDSCEATGSLLFYPDLTADEVMAEIRATIDRVTASDYWLRDHPPVLDLPLDAESAAPWVKEPVNMPFDHPGVATISDVMRIVSSRDPVVETAPFVCDANFWFPLGQPSLIFGLGDPSWGIHGTNEFLPVDDLIEATKVFAAVTMAWCGVVGVSVRRRLTHARPISGRASAPALPIVAAIDGQTEAGRQVRARQGGLDRAGGECLPISQQDRVRRRGWNLFQVVRHEHGGQIGSLLAEAVEGRDQRLARGEVETNRRLVKQQQPRVRDQRAGNADPAPFSLGARRDLALGKVCTPQQRQQVPRPGSVFVRIRPPQRP